MKKSNLIVILFVLTVCAAVLPAQTAVKVTVYGLKGPSGVGMIRLFENPPHVPGYDIQVEALAQADLMAAKFISGEAQIGMLPPNTAAKIAASGKKIQIAAVTGTGMLSLLSADPAVRRIEDLKGKTMEAAGQGATPEYVLRKILLSKGINPDKDVRIGYALAYPEIAQALISGRVNIALLPEPFATMARNGNSGINTVDDIQDEWIKLHRQAGANYPMTVFVVDASFAAAHSGLMRTVLESLKNSIEWVQANPAAAGLLVEKHDLGLRAAAVSAAIPRSGYVCIPAVQARPAIEALLRAFLEFAPASVGGALPRDDFYYNPR